MSEKFSTAKYSYNAIFHKCRILSEMKSFLKFSLCIIVAHFFSATVHAQTFNIELQSLSINDAIKIALEHHPSLRVAEANLRSASASLKQTESAYYPSVNATASATHTEGAFVFNPAIPPRTQIYSNYSTGVQIQQLVYDFGKTSERINVNDQLVNATTSDLRSTRDNVIMNVQIAYLNLAQALQVVQVNEAAVNQSMKHLAQAKAFYTVGRRPQLDVTKAEVDLANANVNLIRARNQTRIARLQLENAMGIHPLTMYTLTDTLGLIPFHLSLDSAKGFSFLQRADLISARARFYSLQSLVNVAWAQNLPTLSATGAYTWNGFDFPLASRWNAGITLSLPLFQGFSIDAQVEQARANADAAKANLDQLTESVLLEVEQNYLAIEEADERISATSKLVEQASLNLNLAERQYAAGVGTPLDMSDAQLALSNARLINIQALYDFNSALVRLKKAIGAVENN